MRMGEEETFSQHTHGMLGREAARLLHRAGERSRHVDSPSRSGHGGGVLPRARGQESSGAFRPSYAGQCPVLQGYLTHKKHPPPRTLQ